MAICKEVRKPQSLRGGKEAAILTRQESSNPSEARKPQSSRGNDLQTLKQERQK